MFIKQYNNFINNNITYTKVNNAANVNTKVIMLPAAISVNIKIKKEINEKAIAVSMLLSILHILQQSHGQQQFSPLFITVLIESKFNIINNTKNIIITKDNIKYGNKVVNNALVITPKYIKAEIIPPIKIDITNKQKSTLLF